MRIHLCGMGIGVSIMEFDAETRYRPIYLDVEELINGQNEMIRIFKHFSTLVKSGELYDFIAKNLGESSRDIGKSLTFETLFGKVYKEDSEGIALIRSYFPTVLSIIHSFKNTYSYRYLPNLLQSVESTIIVDTVLQELYEEGYTTILTKHDSFIYPNFIEIDNTDIKDIIFNRLFVILGDIFSYRVKTYPHNVVHF